MYWTSVSECFVPEMNVTAETSGQSPCRRTTSSAPSPFSTVITAAPGQCPASDAAAASSPPAFVATIARSGTGNSAAEVAAETDAVKSALPGDAQPVLVQRPRVLLPPAQHRHLRDAGEVPGEEGADHARADDADALDHAAASFPCR